MVFRPAQPTLRFHMVEDLSSGLDGVIALHSTARGPAAGGCRLRRYPDCEAMARDAGRLAEGMSYKNALADLPLGGGKAVLAMPAEPFDRAALFTAFGRAVGELRGRYVTAEDAGTSVADMQAVAQVTRHVAGLPAKAGRPGGDPSPWTARGVLLSMRLVAERRLDRSLADCTVAIQGVGHVGAALAAMLHAEGARLVIADTDSAAVARVALETGAVVVPVQAILSSKADILAPCALGGVITEHNVGRIAAKAICGAANNQLADPEDGARLADAGVLYAPDYVVNAGGIISVAAEYLAWDVEEVARRVDATPRRLAQVLDAAERAGVATNAAADLQARSMLERRAPSPDLALAS